MHRRPSREPNRSRDRSSGERHRRFSLPECATATSSVSQSALTTQSLLTSTASPSRSSSPRLYEPTVPSRDELRTMWSLGSILASRSSISAMSGSAESSSMTIKPAQRRAAMGEQALQAALDGRRVAVRHHDDVGTGLLGHAHLHECPPRGILPQRCRSVTSRADFVKKRREKILLSGRRGKPRSAQVAIEGGRRPSRGTRVVLSCQGRVSNFRGPQVQG